MSSAERIGSHEHQRNLFSSRQDGQSFYGVPPVDKRLFAGIDACNWSSQKKAVYYERLESGVLVPYVPEGCAKRVPKETKVDDPTIELVYDRIADHYDEHMREGCHPGELYEKVEFKKNLGSVRGKTILDVGAGVGWTSTVVLEKGLENGGLPRKLILVDISSHMLTHARANIEQYCTEKGIRGVEIEYIHSSASRLIYNPDSKDTKKGLEKFPKIAPESIDTVVSFNALDCMDKVNDVLKTAYIALKPERGKQPGGKLVGVIRHPDRNKWYLKRDYHKNLWVWENFPGTGNQPVLHCYRTTEKWHKKIRRAGFIIADIIATKAPNDLLSSPDERVRSIAETHMLRAGGQIWIGEKNRSNCR